MSAQIVVCVVCQICDRSPVCFCGIIDLYFIRVSQCIRNSGFHISRKSLLHIQAQISKGDTVIFSFFCFCVPDRLVKPVRPAVKIILIVVCLKDILHTVDLTFRTCDPVCVPSDHRPEITGLPLIFCRIVIA